MTAATMPTVTVSEASRGRPRARRWRALVVAGLLLAPAPAAADRIDALTGALLGDPSYRVKLQAAITLGRLKTHEPRAVQALLEALHDDNESVRAVAAASLAHVGDASALDGLRVAAAADASTLVRAQAEKAVAALAALAKTQSAAAPSKSPPRPRFFLDVGAIRPGKIDAEAARRAHDRITAALGRLPSVTLSPDDHAPVRFHVDGSVTNLSSSAPDATGKVRTECDARLVVATLPENAIKMMASLGGSLDGTAEPSDIAASRTACLDDIGEQIAEKVQIFLETQR